MLRFILFIILIFILSLSLHFLIKDMLLRKRRKDRELEPEELVQDPYCKTYIPKRSAVKKKFAGRLLYFCNQECLKNYVKITKDT
jgi:uncharacterized protein